MTIKKRSLKFANSTSVYSYTSSLVMLLSSESLEGESRQGFLNAQNAELSFFLAIRGLSQKCGVTPPSIGSTHATLLFFRWVKSQREADQNIHSFNRFIQSASLCMDHLRCPAIIHLHSLLSFTHSLASGIVSPLSLKQPFTPSIHLLLGLPLPLLPSTISAELS